MTEVQSAGHWPTLTDDPTPATPSTGTNLTADTFENASASIAAAIDDQCHAPGANYQNTRPRQITAEVIDARGTAPDLDTRLSTVLGPDGAFIVPSGIVSSAYQAQLASKLNGMRNDQFIVWADGDAAAPTGWTLSGTGAAVARGAALGRGYLAGVTYGSSTAKLAQDIVPAALATQMAALLSNGYQLSAGGVASNPLQWQLVASITSATTGIGRIALFDGNQRVYSAFCLGPGNGGLMATSPMQLDFSTTQLTAEAYVENTGSVSFGNFMLVPYFGGGPGTSSGAYYTPSLWVRKEHVIHFAGNQAAGTRKWAWTPRRMGIIDDIQLTIGTGPATQALIIDINTWDGAALTSMFGTRPQIAAAATEGSGWAFGTYARRCLQPFFGTTKSKGGLVTLDIDQVGVGTVGADLTITIGYLECASPYEGLYNFNTV